MSSQQNTKAPCRHIAPHLSEKNCCNSHSRHDPEHKCPKYLYHLLTDFSTPLSFADFPSPALPMSCRTLHRSQLFSYPSVFRLYQAHRYQPNNQTSKNYRLWLKKTVLNRHSYQVPSLRSDQTTQRILYQHPQPDKEYL